MGKSSRPLPLEELHSPQGGLLDLLKFALWQVRTFAPCADTGAQHPAYVLCLTSWRLTDKRTRPTPGYACV